MTHEKAAYSKAELAAQLGVSKDSVNRAIKRGEIKIVRFGRRVLIPCDQLARLLCQEQGCGGQR
jgi:excisionase family DNA binding protein